MRGEHCLEIDKVLVLAVQGRPKLLATGDVGFIHTQDKRNLRHTTREIGMENECATMVVQAVLVVGFSFRVLATGCCVCTYNGRSV